MDVRTGGCFLLFFLFFVFLFCFFPSVRVFWALTQFVHRMLILLILLILQLMRIPEFLPPGFCFFSLVKSSPRTSTPSGALRPPVSAEEHTRGPISASAASEPACVKLDC